MKIDVWTGQTRAPSSTMLVPVILGTEKGDRVFFAFHSEGKSDGSDNLRDECISVLTHAVLEGEGEGYTRLESALKELNGLLKGFLLSEAVRDVHAIVGLLEKDGVLHLSHVGRAEAYVIREGTALQITELSRGKPPAAFMHIVSGPVHSRDHFIVSTTRLLRSMTPAQLTQAVHGSGEAAVQTIVSTLTSEKEVACIVHIAMVGSSTDDIVDRSLEPRRKLHMRRDTRQKSSVIARILVPIQSIQWNDMVRKIIPRKLATRATSHRVTEKVKQFIGDLYDPDRKRRAHLFLLAGSAALFIIIWMLVQLAVVSQKSKTKGELVELMQQITADLSTAENRQLAGDADSANAILERAEERARQVMSNENGLYRSEALELLDRIKSKREEMNRVIRITPPRVMANLSAKKSDIVAQGFIGLPNGEFIVYDREDLYPISLNTVENATTLGSDQLILDGASFSRFQNNVFMTTGNSVTEVAGDKITSMKTEDPAGWITGADMKAYLRYLYILSPERKQIFKYERLSSRYGPPSEYNVDGDLEGAIDMTIVGPVYVLKDTSVGGKEGQRDIVKLLRGEKQTFNIRNLPTGALNNTTKIVKSSTSGNFYFLDPIAKRVVVSTNDGDLGDSLYLKQYVLDSEQVGTLKDLYIDSEDTRLFVLDEKKLYVIDLQAR